ncbi:unnamed protein product [Linum trigynum]|uniref:Uncharacterized protein n=1 Tax=Linum trigynum TaxID=586398 RepID=A0AAV2E297_9ROSI
MTRSQSGGLLPLDPELERTCRQLRRQQRARLATEERIDGQLSNNSKEEYEMDGEHNPHQGNPLQVPLVNQILGNNPIPQEDGVHHHPPPPGPTLEYYYPPRVVDIRLSSSTRPSSEQLRDQAILDSTHYIICPVLWLEG